MLTEKQKELLLFIHSRMQELGVPPSFDEMKDALDLKSKSGIHRLITALVERGFIRRLPHRARAIEVIRLPENSAEARSPRRPGFQPSVIEGSRSRDLAPPPSTVIDSRTVSVPVMGPHCGRHAHQRHPEPHPRHRLPTGSPYQRRALRAGGEGRFHDRSRHFWTATSSSSAAATRPRTATSWWPSSTRRRQPSSGCVRKARPSRSKPPTPSSRRASSGPTRWISRAGSSASSAATEADRTSQTPPGSASTGSPSSEGGPRAVAFVTGRMTLALDHGRCPRVRATVSMRILPSSSM